MTDQELFLTWWAEAWEEGMGTAAWSASVEGLTAEQAAWRPRAAPGPGGAEAGPRHSIWQQVEHIIFWRGNLLGRMDGGGRPTAEELAARNFPEITDVSEEAWADARRRLAESQERVAAAVRDRFEAARGLLEFVVHDSYHFGQINLVRGMLGLRPIA